MKMKLLLSLLAVLTVSQAFSGDDFDSIRGDTSRSRSGASRASTVDTVEMEVMKGIKQKCNYSTGCALFVDEGNGNEFKVTVGGGVGPNYGNGGNGINIYGYSSNEEYYGITFTFVHSNFQCVRRVNEATFKLIETYERLMASHEYVERVFNAWKRGEDLQTPEAVKTALSVLATVKPSQGNCGQTNNYTR